MYCFWVFFFHSLFLNPPQRKDFLQILLNVEEDSRDGKADDAKKENDLHDFADATGDESYFDAKKSSKTTLTREEIYGQVRMS